MNIVKADNLACPIDGNRLIQRERQWLCDNGHSFDIARQGYVNLLPVQHKRSKQPGDSKAMVVARTEFLDSGIYQPIAEGLSALIHKLLHKLTTDSGTICIFDAGCGEGYYLDRVLTTFASKSGEACFIGLDISKDAILQATKRNRQINWVVGTNRQPPVAAESVDIILCLFGFISAEAFSKILKPGGRLITVDPGPEHLKELRKIIYPQLKKTEAAGLAKKEIPGFSLLSSEALKFKRKITSNERINQLLLMTPHFYRASKDGREQACGLQELEITVDVIFRVFEKP